MLTLFFLKIILCVSVVLALSFIAERVSPKWAGLMGGYPLGVALALGFIAYEQGLSFAALSSVHSVAGLAANMAMLGTYGLCLARWPDASVWRACALSLGAFFTTGVILSGVEFTLPTAYGFIIAIILGALYLFRNLPENGIDNPVKLKKWVPLVRGLVAAACVIIITALAETLGEARAGILAAFPLTVFPLLIIVHISYGSRPVITIVKHYPKGLAALLIFCLIFALYLEELGLGLGMLAAFGAATIYIASYGLIDQRRLNRA